MSVCFTTLRRNNNCDTNAKCINTIGSYSCKCLNGYENNNDLQEDGVNCTDVDECDDYLSCPQFSTCTNYIGQYDCTCNKGYVQSQVNPCFEIECKNRTTCDDVDECQINNGNCEQFCINAVGTYWLVFFCHYTGTVCSWLVMASTNLVLN